MRIKKTSVIIEPHDRGAQARSVGGGGGGGGVLPPCKQAAGSPPPAPPPLPPQDASTNNNHHDADFTHDNSDYQWFLDYNYRDSSCQHTSVLSSLSSSYKGLGSLACYEELARDLDANLAEADMESFRTQDIHALLSNLPPSACHLMQEDTNRRGEMYASVTSSMMEKFCFDSSFSPQSSDQGEDSTAGSINTMSLCKSELLFSPVREAAGPLPGHFSVDSLDCDRLEQDLILTCRANKHNYTIAFEGSITMYSEDSDCQDASNEKQDLPGEAKYSSSSETHDPTTYSTEKINKSFRLSRPLNASMAQSDSGFTTWSKLKTRSSQSQLRRHPSGNNNTTSGRETGMPVVKSQSAPDLRTIASHCRCLSSSSSAHALSTSNVENRFSVPGGCIKVYNAHKANCANHSIDSQVSEALSSSNDSRGPNNNSSKPHNLNLVKLFMKQKSMSNDGIVGSAMDQSSECWPNSSEGGDSGDSFSTDSKTRGTRATKMNLSSDKDYQSDDCDAAQPEPKTITNKWMENDTNNYSTCTFEDSLVEGTNNTDALVKRTHDFIIEEDELSEKSDGSDKNIYATVNKIPQMRFNVNNNNSFGSITGSPIRVRGNATTQTKKSMNSSMNTVSISSISESEGTQMTRMPRLKPKDMYDNKATSTQLPMDVLDKSMQTSCMTSFHLTKDRGHLRVVEPSFLEKLKKGDKPKPVYVLYPNYTLPDLGFISTQQDMEKVFLKPFKYAPTEDANKKTQKQTDKSKRPFSCNDVEGLRKKGFNHIRDWDSLTFLLPMEYRQILAEMPEIVQQMKDKEDEILRQKERPLFCVSPPVRHKVRPASCDCGSLMSGNATNVSSSSSTATQPSSGYRGSSTMLTDSSAQNSPAPAPGFNPLFVYKYDSATSSEASFMNDKQRVGAPPLPKRSISLAEQNKMAVNGKVIDVAPPRPPLPKSILRKSMDKMRKNPPNSKRYSMIEMEDHAPDAITCMNIQAEQKNLKRRSLQEPYYLLKNNSIVEMKKNNDLAAKRFSQQFLDAAEKDMDEIEFFNDEGVGTESSLESGKSHDTNNTRPPTPPLPKLHSKNLSEAPMTLPSHLTHPIISSSDLQQLEDFLKHSGISCHNMEDWDINHMQRVKNQVSRFLSMKQSQEDKESLNSSCSSGHSKKSVSFAEKGEEKRSGESKFVEELKAMTPPHSPVISALPHRHYQAKNLAEIPIREEGESSPEGYASPIFGHGLHRSASNDTAQKRGLVTAVVEAVEMVLEEGADISRLVVGTLCPALYALMKDGLRESIETSFGPANNSVWQVIEASARQGPITKSLNELVMRINSEDALSESVLKFNAFIMGLLNVRSLDAFISYLRTRESVLRRHYSSGALVRDSGGVLGGQAGRALQAALVPLASVPFRLDLLWQLRDMHRSFRRMEDLMSNDSPTASGQLSKNQRNLLRLVHSVQSSVNASSDDQREPTPQASVIMRQKNQNTETLPDLLNNSGPKETVKVRPRSCVNPTIDTIEGTNNSGSGSFDPTRRWSGVHLGSKLIQAFDRLALYDDSEEYTDSLESDKQKSGATVKKDQLECPPEESNSSSGEWASERGGGKFRRLQRRWEMLSGQETPAAPGSPQRTSNASAGSTPGSASSTPGSTSSQGRSRIPRPVTSPVRPSAPQSPANTVSPVKRSIPVPIGGNKKVTTPPSTGLANHKSPLPPLPQGQVGARTAVTNTGANKKPANNTNRVSRLESVGGGAPAPRPSSLPYRRAPPPSVGRPRRAASTSQPRPAAPNRTNNQTTKMVRTLWHRLPSDSGHLAFNEGERLRLVLEVDDQWLLCCRGQHKGLVPRNAVIPVPETALQRF